MWTVAVIGFGAAAAGIAIPATAGQHAAVDETQYLLTAISLAEDGDLDIADELAARRWLAFADDEPPVQTATRADGRAISPHDPLLPLLLAGPVALGGWIGAKLALAACAGALAAAMLWTAVRRFAVRLRVAAPGVAIAAASAPLAVYGQQLYPELPAALTVVLGVAALTGPADRRHLAVLAAVIVAAPWLSVKYVPVVAVLAALGGYRWWRAGRRTDVLLTSGALALAGAAYLAVHRMVWGGWTVYASGDHFATRGGEFTVVGDDISVAGRSVRLLALLTDRDYGLLAWQPAFLLLIPAAAALLSARAFHARHTRCNARAEQEHRAPTVRGGLVRRRPGVGGLLAPLAVGWLVAAFVAATMHGFWWPGRHLVMVLPLAVLAILVWVGSAGTAVRLAALALGMAGVVTYAGLLVAGYTGEFTWVSGLDAVGGPLRALLPDYRATFWVPHLLWCAASASLALGVARITNCQVMLHSS